ncbi:MAG: hypothetical protein Q9169_003210 [Polycauliona sp. 2 TL-2023]
MAGWWRRRRRLDNASQARSAHQKGAATYSGMHELMKGCSNEEQTLGGKASIKRGGMVEDCDQELSEWGDVYELSMVKKRYTDDSVIRHLAPLQPQPAVATGQSAGVPTCQFPKPLVSDDPEQIKSVMTSRFIAYSSFILLYSLAPESKRMCKTSSVPHDFDMAN